jgi:WD40 repeat protein
VRVWRLSNYQPVQTIDEGMSSVMALAFSPEGTWLAWGEAGGAVRVHSAAGHTWRYTFADTHSPALALCFALDGSWLAAGFEDGAIRVWSMSDGVLLQSLRSHTGAISALMALPDGGLLSASADTTLRRWLWDGARFGDTPNAIFTGPATAILSAALAPDGATAAAGAQDGSIFIWAIANP